jgi:hypothetical protein
MQSFSAKVDAVVIVPDIGRTNFAVSIILGIGDNKCYGINVVSGTQNLADFGRTLKENTSYEFPKMLLQFEATNGKVD